MASELDVEIDYLRAAAAPMLPVLPDAAWLPYALVRKPDGRLDKPPQCNSTTSRPESWFTLEGALVKLRDVPEVHGVGFAITDGVITLDYDNCRDPVTGALVDDIQAELERFNSYAYVTPSGKGIRIVGTGKLQGGKRNRYLPSGHKIEIFVGPTNHFNTFTSQTLAGYDALRDISAEVTDYLVGLPGSNNAERSDSPPASAKPERCIEAIRAALKCIPNDKQDWDFWIRYGLAVFRSSGGSGDGREAWREWSSKHPCHDDAELDRSWERFHRSPPTKISFGTLYYEARRNNPLFVPPYDPFVSADGDAARASASKQEPLFDAETGELTPFAATPLEDLDLDNIPPRAWLYGRELLRGFVSVLGSPGGVGKTALTQAIAVAIALKRPLLAHDKIRPSVFQAVHATGKVWLYNLEDPSDELRRRIKALLKHYGINKSEIGKLVFMDSGRDRPLIITKRDERGNIVAHPVFDDLVAELKRRGIVLLVVDPFVQSHSAEENRNEEMNAVMSLWGRVAHKAGCAVWLIHHFRKGGQGGDSDAFRGAAAIQGAARVMSTLSAMTPEEASKLGIEIEHRRQFVRLDNAKANMAPPADRAEWYRLVSVSIDNPSDAYPDGDQVQTIESWEPPSPWEGLAWSTINRILDKLETGPSPDEKYAAAKQSKDRWAGHVLVELAGKTDGQAASIIKAWIENGVLESGQYASPSRNGALASCVSVNPIKAAEMRKLTVGSATNDD